MEPDEIVARPDQPPANQEGAPAGQEEAPGVTLTDPDGRAVGHGCGRRPRHRPPGGRRRAGPAGPRDGTGPPTPDGLSFTITPITVRDCDHRNERSGY